MYKMLVVDDEESITQVLKTLFKGDYDVSVASSGTDGLALIKDHKFDVVISDIVMRDISGVQLLRECKKLSPETVFILMTAYASAETAIEALGLQAYAYVTKPFDDIDLLKDTVRDGLEQNQNSDLFRSKSCKGTCGLHRLLDDRKLKELMQSLDLGRPENILVGESPKIVEICKLIFRIAPVDSTVLITGEGGTGKELIARAIHDGSRRRDRPFVPINCGSQVETLLESELFGYKKGAFTGANSDKKGLFEEADTGTLFLDEIGEMSPTMQVKLLRALQEKRIRRVGGNEEISIDVRIIAATNQDLREAVIDRRFREDFYYRLAVIKLELPPLRERPGDLPLLAAYFLHLFSKKANKAVSCISEEAMRHIQNYAWPGNVRELRNAIEHAVALESTKQIKAERLPDEARFPMTRVTAHNGFIDLPRDGFDLEKLVEEIEKKYIARAMDLSRGNQSEAAKILGIPVRSLRYKLDKIKRNVLVPS
ncbi:MAG: sigma-54-dependent Fis family transcriptional regulator [Acidobacteria bacterium]|nr:sigma-54-dependent Fis family transcriptional regulator [Acidobacteriota bacterium]MBI3656287.1 sigma-54-dependent Fis family transcriptional regulator [Acidobacteriota bacterium]